MSDTFLSLTPNHVLAAVERLGTSVSGRCFLLGSLENRVYDIELEDRSHLIAKFYRPNRHSDHAIADEHQVLSALAEAEIPVAAPIPFDDGTTLSRTEDGIRFALFPKIAGRSPDEMNLDEFHQIGKIIGRIHSVMSSVRPLERPELSARTYGTQCIEKIVSQCDMPGALRSRYEHAARSLVSLAAQCLGGDSERRLIHADLHRGNLLRTRNAFCVLDFDDMAIGPPVQDLWLLLPSRPSDCPAERDALISGYERIRPLNRYALRCIEPLRGLRYIRYAAWIAERWHDPAFPRAFPQFGSAAYWQGQLSDLHDQIRLIEEEN